MAVNLAKQKMQGEDVGLVIFIFLHVFIFIIWSRLWCVQTHAKQL